VQALVKPYYTCPSDIETDRLDYPESGPGSGLLYRRGSYRAVSGGSDGSAWFDDCCNNLPVNWRGAMHSTCQMRNLTTERLDDIQDGTSNTIIVANIPTAIALVAALSGLTPTLRTINLPSPRINLAC
jgi:hypothetical protein